MVMATTNEKVNGLVETKERKKAGRPPSKTKAEHGIPQSFRLNKDEVEELENFSKRTGYPRSAIFRKGIKMFMKSVLELDFKQAS